VESIAVLIEPTIAKEFRILLQYSWPVVLSSVLQNSLRFASLISLGHMGSIGKGRGRIPNLYCFCLFMPVCMGVL
jgi:Na+-driven multidrug efflux pump